MTTDRLPWREQLRRRTSREGRTPSVATLKGWRRFVRPAAFVAVAATAGAGGAIWVNHHQTPAGPSTAPEPTGVAVANARTVSVLATATDGCRTDRASYSAGKLTVSVTNKDAVGLGAVSLSRGADVVGEREGITPGSTASFTVDLPAGSYTLTCPGTGVERRTLRITGAGPDVPVGSIDTRVLLQRASTVYGRYVQDETAAFVRAVEDMSAAFASDDVAAAQRAYCRVKIHLKRIEDNPGVEQAFESGDAEVEDGLEDVQQGLFERKRAKSLASAGNALVAQARRVQQVVAGVPFDVTSISLGALEMLNGVFRGAIMGREEEWSRYDLLDIDARVDGADAAYRSLRPAVVKVDGVFATKLDAAFAALRAELAKFRAPGELGGVRPYHSLTRTDLVGISHAVQAVVEPVSRLGSKVTVR